MERKNKYLKDSPLTTEEAAEYLGLSLGGLYNKTSRGEIGYIKIGSRNYYPIEELDKYLDRVAKYIPSTESEEKGIL